MSLVPASHHIYYVAAAYAIALAALGLLLILSWHRCRTWRKRADARSADFSPDLS